MDEKDWLLQEEIQVGIIRGEFQWLDKKHLIQEENMCLVSTEELNLDELPSVAPDPLPGSQAGLEAGGSNVVFAQGSDRAVVA